MVVGKYEHKYRVLTHAEKMKYAMAMRRMNLGCWGYTISTLIQIHLTTREGNDNTTKVFARDLRKLVARFRDEGYDLEYNGALEYTPGKSLLHWHGLFRVKGGYFPITRRMLGDLWNEIHSAFVVKIKKVNSGNELIAYIFKHILKKYIGEDDKIRNKFLFSRGWMRPGWKEVEGIAKLWVLGGMSPIFMTKEGWSKVNEIMLAWTEKRKVMFLGQFVNGVIGDRTGYLFVEMGRIREAVGGAFESSDYEYYEY